MSFLSRIVGVFQFFNLCKGTWEFLRQFRGQEVEQEYRGVKGPHNGEEIGY